MNRVFSWLCAVCVVVMVLWALWMPWGLIVTWIGVSLCTVAFLLCVGAGISGRPLGVLINEQNLMSLSRFQTALWTVIIVSGLVVIVAARVRHVITDGDPLDIKFTPQVLGLLGISAAALVGSPLIDATKKDKPADPKAMNQTAAALVKTQNVPDSVLEQTKKAEAAATKEHVDKALEAAGTNADSAAVSKAAEAASKPAAAAEANKVMASTITQNAVGVLYKNPSISDASFSDMFEGSEVGNAAQVDLAKVQMFFFTLVVALGYIYAFTAVLRKQDIYGASFSFPPLSDAMIALLGISNGGYLGSKAVNHTPTTTT